jgi:hypothetical protein
MAILEIRTYRLLPGTRSDFVHVMRDIAVPLLHQFGIRVVDCGRSLVDEDGLEEAYLIRAFDSLAEREAQEEAFYGSPEWHDGPRTDILSRIEAYHTIVLDMPESAITALTPDPR